MMPAARPDTEIDSEIEIFDTTLRDGEQSPGISLSKDEKLEIAEQLARLGVATIEAGFPIASPGDFEAVRQIAERVEGPTICALARANAQDIRSAGEALEGAGRSRIHTFISTSDIHIIHQLGISRKDVLGLARAAVAQARELADEVEFSPMDASRADWDFTAEVIEVALDQGASIINIPDTVGCMLPEEYARLLLALKERVPGLSSGKVLLSTHCHDDLGLAVSNSLAGVQVGARQIECAVNGIGERAGNAALEEVVMAIRTHSDLLGFDTRIRTQELARTSRLVSRLTGYQVPPNKAIVGANAFAHESGIHQDGVLKERSTYESIRREDVGVEESTLVLGKHSGRHALSDALSNLGYELTGSELPDAFRRFKELADKKKEVTSFDLEALVADERREGGILAQKLFELEFFDIASSSDRAPFARVRLRSPEGRSSEGRGEGDGPIDALFEALNQATSLKGSLREYRVQAVSEGRDALGEVSVRLEIGGRRGSGQAVSTDTAEASAIAYLRALAAAQMPERRPLGGV